MNQVFYKGRKSPLTNSELAEADSLYGLRKKQLPYDETRLQGNMCECNGDGEFIISRTRTPDMDDGGKAYMQCRKCGRTSHL